MNSLFRKIIFLIREMNSLNRKIISLIRKMNSLNREKGIFGTVGFP